MKIQIIVVDDEIEVGEMLADYLSSEGYAVDAESDPVIALKRIETENYLILITDLRMPMMSGIDLIREVKKINGFVQIITITGFVTVNDILTAFRLGANNCFFKPFGKLEEIKQEVDLAIAKLTRIETVLREFKQLPSELTKRSSNERK